MEPKPWTVAEEPRYVLLPRSEEEQRETLLSITRVHYLPAGIFAVYDDGEERIILDLENGQRLKRIIEMLNASGAASNVGRVWFEEYLEGA